MSKLSKLLEHPLAQFLLEKLLFPLIPGYKATSLPSPTEATTKVTTEEAKQESNSNMEENIAGAPAIYTPTHFDLTEFQCNHCGQLPPNGMNPILLYKLDQLRDRIGAPLYITSGYRCITHNAAVGGVSNSQHIKGNAADIYTDAMDATQLAELCKEIGFDGIGLYAQSDFVHVDVRDDGKSSNYYIW